MKCMGILIWHATNRLMEPRWGIFNILFHVYQHTEALYDDQQPLNWTYLVQVDEFFHIELWLYVLE